ncbi:MAG: 7-cyano-7-deazaguanine synthase, partial [Proteobacteria bacterium]|nr:7-cyano-7-deazaguanine synthase [Pseudomonadota bacterium]
MQALPIESAKKSKALVLCSSGLDSVYNLVKAKKDFLKTAVVFFDYSQKAAAQEYVHVKKLCEALDLDFIKIDLP